MPRSVMCAVLCSVFVCSMLQAVSGSQAWSEFEASGLQAASSSRRLMAYGLDSRLFSTSVQVQPIVNQAGAATNVDPAYQRFVTVNDFIAGGKTDGTQIQQRILDLCRKGAAGTEFAYMNTSKFDGVKVAEPLCYYCLTRGFGVDQGTPGFYLPCGCQRTCVDVSGYTQGSFSAVQTSASASFFGPSTSVDGKAAGGFPFLSNSVANSGLYGNGKGSYGQPMTSCQDYIDNKIVTTCNGMFIYHFVLWPSVMGAVALLYSAYSIATMPLDMDSLLYTVGSSSKKDS